MPEETAQQTFLIKAGAALTPRERLEDAYILVDGGHIARIGSLQGRTDDWNLPILEAPDEILAPGYIDMHIHGSAGIDVMDCSFEEFDRVTQALARHGTTAFLPTTMTAPTALIMRALERLGQYVEQPVSGAKPLGIHMEGPFINPLRRGTHPAEHILPPSVDLLRGWCEISRRHVRMMTIAPEMAGSPELIRAAAAMKLLPAIGHSDATEAECLAAIENGARHCIHVFNAMRPFKHRDPGIVGVSLADDRLSSEVIADGIHVHPSAVKVLWRAKPDGQFLLVTDATSATGMPDGEYRIGDKAIFVKDGVCCDAQGTLAGSTLTLDRAVRNLKQWSSCRWEQAVAAASLNPARLLGVSELRGTLQPGAFADINFLDEDGTVLRSMAAGRFVSFD